MEPSLLCQLGGGWFIPLWGFCLRVKPLVVGVLAEMLQFAQSVM